RCSRGVQHTGLGVAHSHSQHALPLRHRRHRRCGACGAVLAETFVVTEEERAVPQDRSADRAAELVAIKLRLLPGCGLEVALGRECTVTKELPSADLKPVRPAAVGYVDRGPGRAAVL